MTAGTTAVLLAQSRPRRPGFFKNLFYWVMDWDDPATLEAGIQRMRNAPRYFASLSPEALQAIRSYDGPENHGPPLTRWERRELERRIASRNP